MRRFSACAALMLVGCLGLASGCGGEDPGTYSADIQDQELGAERCNTAAKSSDDPRGLSYGPSCQALVEQFPSIEADDSDQDKKVLCPFVRILKKSNELADSIAANLSRLRNAVFPVSVAKVTSTAVKFGCSTVSCGGVATLAAAGQLVQNGPASTPLGVIDIGRLHTSKGVAHDCGFNFALGETSVNDQVQEDTLNLLKSKAVDGRLTHEDLVETKKAMCLRDFNIARSTGKPTLNKVSASNDTLVPSQADNIEVDLIYTYLGGVDNGYILYSDIELFFRGRMPANKTKYVVGTRLFQHLNAVLSEDSSSSP